MPGPLYMLNKCLIISIMDMYSWKRTWKWSASIFSFYKYDNEPREKWWLKQSKSEIKYHVWNSTVQSPSSSTVVSLISLLFCIISITLFPVLSLSLSLRYTQDIVLIWLYKPEFYPDMRNNYIYICLLIFGSGDVIIVECF